jgi:hypothetical protein
MEGSELARALVKRRWGAVDARKRVRGKWAGANNPNAAKTWEEKRWVGKRLAQARYSAALARHPKQLKETRQELYAAMALFRAAMGATPL